MRRGPASGRFLPARAADAALIQIMHDARNPAAVALGSMGGRATADKRRAKVWRVMNALRAEMGMPPA